MAYKTLRPTLTLGNLASASAGKIGGVRCNVTFIPFQFVVSPLTSQGAAAILRFFQLSDLGRASSLERFQKSRRSLVMASLTTRSSSIQNRISRGWAVNRSRTFGIHARTSGELHLLRLRLSRRTGLPNLPKSRFHAPFVIKIQHIAFHPCRCASSISKS